MPKLKPKRILYVELVGRGEFLWTLPLAKALKERGHDVQFLTFRKNEEDCRAAGVKFREWVTPPWRGSTAGFGDSRPYHGRWIRQGIYSWRLRADLQNAAIPGLYEIIEEESRTADLLVAARHNALGAHLAYEKLGVPLVGLYPQPAPLRSCFHEPGLPIPEGSDWPRRAARSLYWWGIDLVVDHFQLPEFNRQRRRLGLHPIRRPFHGWVHSAGLNVGFFPEFFGPVQPDWPPNLVLAGFPLPAYGESAAPPAGLSDFLKAGEAPVVFTRGSHTYLASAFFEKAVEVCARLGVRGVLAGNASGFDSRRLPPSVMAPGYIPFEALLPRASAIVHHGGIGTTGHSLAAGLPQVITPMINDQFYNARRARQLGVANVLGPNEWSAESIARALKDVLGSPEIRRRSLALRDEVRRETRLEAACVAIEDYWRRASDTS